MARVPGEVPLLLSARRQGRARYIENLLRSNQRAAALERDVQSAPSHPLPEQKQLAFSGRVALDRAPVS